MGDLCVFVRLSGAPDLNGTQCVVEDGAVSADGRIVVRKLAGGELVRVKPENVVRVVQLPVRTSTTAVLIMRAGVVVVERADGGRGVVAVAPLAEGDLLLLEHTLSADAERLEVGVRSDEQLMQHLHPRSARDARAKVAANQFAHEVYEEGEAPMGALGLHVSMLNHSNEPNAAVAPLRPEGSCVTLSAVVCSRAVQPGEEVTIDYGRGHEASFNNGGSDAFAYVARSVEAARRALRSPELARAVGAYAGSPEAMAIHGKHAYLATAVRVPAGQRMTFCAGTLLDHTSCHLGLQEALARCAAGSQPLAADHAQIVCGAPRVPRVQRCLMHDQLEAAGEEGLRSMLSGFKKNCS